MKTELLIITALESELKRESLPRGVEIVYSGVGKINAAMTCIKAIQQYSPKRILNFGTAGKIKTELQGLLEIGKVIQRDMDAEPLAPRGNTPFCTRPQEYLSTGNFLCGSGDSFVTSYDSWLHSQGVDVVDMELFAIAAIAHEHQIPWQSFKYITDEANEDSGEDWQAKVRHGQELFLVALSQALADYS
ncbi:5'-methylthioadenosine/S-adenosylhomocysteine nucleosidase [Polynucleobacter sp. AP-Nickl1-40-C4]|uniref:5'-methylthioadenosine/S-adenosylhomocysteine nucleosidase family protein n=1 Tax=Polynucleobacter sp. AP-Nickl1-40-C4 TaxID=3108275 RepID=UPI002B235B87|nr:5'-methylthioadenosine/S-adenosylhomocysteine nucleosidase [Polynucleobacter sp. AP-Nickl1-40-C4]MEA9567575.1 5'-methylthioadenosine/S-adenosylhomocysteine nucleosidase [Polynucleobacter sp. AP-Nickl1-40-C4]